MIHSEESSGANIIPNSQQHHSKKYAQINHQIRVQLLKRILSKQATIKEAAKEFGVNFSTAKQILQIYRKEGRIGKKKTRNRNKKKDSVEYQERKVHSMCDLEREVPRHKRTFSPNVRSNPNQIEYELNLLNQSQIGSEDSSVQYALAICQRELNEQRMINMQLMMMLQSYQQVKQEPI